MAGEQAAEAANEMDYFAGIEQLGIDNVVAEMLSSTDTLRVR